MKRLRQRRDDPEEKNTMNKSKRHMEKWWSSRKWQDEEEMTQTFHFTEIL